MQAAIDHLKAELKALRTGRANLRSSIKSMWRFMDLLPLKSLANINVPEARQIVVTPFDP